MTIKTISIFIFILLASEGISQCPPGGHVNGVATATAATCNAAIALARDSAILNADANCPDDCLFELTGVEFISDSVKTGNSCTVKVEVIHRCRPRDDDHHGDGDGGKVNGPPMWLKVLAGAGAVVLAIVTVLAFIEPIPGDELVPAAAAVKLAELAAR